MTALLLALDTSAAHCAAAVHFPDGRLFIRTEDMAKGQAERLMSLLEETLQEAGVAKSDLQAIAVGTGPGNFTGIRISVAAARGLALGLGIPAIGVDGFEIEAEGKPRPLTVTLQGARGSAYRRTLGLESAEPPEVIDETPEAAPPRPASEGIAAIARLAAARVGTAQPRPAPMYVRGADAAPPRDPAPQILPE